jgi:hypothetical protein
MANQKAHVSKLKNDYTKLLLNWNFFTDWLHNLDKCIPDVNAALYPTNNRNVVNIRHSANILPDQVFVIIGPKSRCVNDRRIVLG